MGDGWGGRLGLGGGVEQEEGAEETGDYFSVCLCVVVGVL